MSDLTASDLLAMNRNDGSFLEGNGIIILILFFLMFGGGFGNWGGNSAAAAATQAGVTRAEMQDGFNNQNTVNSLNNMNMGMVNGFNGVNIGMTNGFNSVTQNLNTLGFNMQQCCCDLKTTIGTQADLTRQAIQGVTNLINENTMQNLRDVIADKNRQISEASFDASQATQTAALEAFILANKSTTTSTT